MEWASRIKASGARRAWIYFNNDNDAHAPKNAASLQRTLDKTKKRGVTLL